MVERVRMALATLSSTPWRRAPRLLLRRPGVLGAVAAAVLVVTASAASLPLFLSSVGTESVALQAAERCPQDTGVRLPFVPTPSTIRTRGDDPFAPLGGQVVPAGRWARIDDAFLAPTEGGLGLRSSVLVRDGALDHVEVLEDAGRPGLWISDRAVEKLGLEAGGVARLGDVEVPIAGVYRDLSGAEVDRYWCASGDMVLVQAAAGDLVPPPLLLLADEALFADLLGRLPEPAARGGWDATLPEDLTVAEADALVARLACAPGASELRWCRDGQPPLPQRVGRSRRELMATSDAQFVETYLSSHLPFVVGRSTAIKTSVAGGVWPIAALGALAGLGLVAAAAALWSDRRRSAVGLLAVRGVSPAGIGLKAVLELLPGLVGGAAVGVGVAYAAVRQLGPSPEVEPGAVGQALLAALAALAGAVIVTGLVVARRSRPAHDRRRRSLSALPWELLLAALTWVSYQRLASWGVPIGRGTRVTRVDLLGLLFPVLFLLTSVAVVSRLLGWAAGPLRRRSAGWPTGPYLAVRRVARHRVALLGLLAASALAAGVLGYAATMRASLDSTLSAKAHTFVGSDVAVRLAAGAPIPPELRDDSTEVDVYLSAKIDRRLPVTVLAVDPATFGRAAYWRAEFADRSLAAILEALAEPRADGSIPAVVIGARLPEGADLEIRNDGTHDVVVAPLEGVRSFPGTRLANPTLVVAEPLLAELGLERPSREVWIAGDRARILAAFDAAGTGYLESRRAQDLIDGATFLTVRWTFGFMQTLGASAGALSLVGVVVYLDARRRDRLLGYAFLRRMGIRRRQHRRALGLELAASVLVGSVLGSTAALVGAAVAHGQIDPVPRYRPTPLLVPAGGLITTVTLLSLVVVAAGAAVAQRRVDRDDPVEVLRAGR